MLTNKTELKQLQWNHTRTEQNALYREYTRFLVQQGDLKSRKELKNMDFIDARPLLKNLGQDHFPTLPFKDGVSKFIRQNNWYVCIPCFETACIQIDANKYLEYHLTNVDLDKQEYDVMLSFYMYHETLGWDVVVESSTHFTFDSISKDKKTAASHLSCTINNPLKLRTKYTEKDLGWSKKDYASYLLLFDSTNRQQIKKHVTNNAHAISELFAKINIHINYLLSLEKPKIKKQANKPDTTATRKISETAKDTPKRRMRTLGEIMIQSKQTPKQTTHQNVIRYQTATWKVRGHLRTYKSGKTVWIKETQRKRQCMQNADQTVPQTIIKIRKPKTEK